jgi:hypothetical protein
MQEGRAPQGATELFVIIEFPSPLQGSALVQLPPGAREKRCPVTTSFGGRGITPKYAERNTLDLRAGALKTPRVSPLASIDIEIAWENPLSSRHPGRGIFCGLSHAISISMAQREALGRSWRFQSPGQRISASRKMRDHIYQLRY